VGYVGARCSKINPLSVLLSTVLQSALGAAVGELRCRSSLLAHSR